MAEIRKSVRDKSDVSELRVATTLADALAEAEIIRSTENILLAMNSLWAWYNALPLAEREEIGRFENKRRLWIAVRFRHRSQ